MYNKSKWGSQQCLFHCALDPNHPKTIQIRSPVLQGVDGFGTVHKLHHHLTVGSMSKFWASPKNVLWGYCTVIDLDGFSPVLCRNVKGASVQISMLPVSSEANFMKLISTQICLASLSTIMQYVWKLKHNPRSPVGLDKKWPVHKRNSRIPWNDCDLTVPVF